MKIIYIHQYFKLPKMSGGVRSFEQAKRMVSDGHKVIMITSDTANYFKGWKIEEYDGIEIHWVSVKYDNKFGFVQRILSFLKFILLASFHMLKIKSDLVYATSTPLTIVIPAIIYKKIKKVPYVFEVRDVWPEVPIALGVIKNSFLKKSAYFLERLAYKNARNIIALSPDMRSSIESRYKLDNIEVIPNAADVSIFRNRSVNKNDPIYLKLNSIKERHNKVLFYTGTFGLVNNLKYLIKLATFSKGELAIVIIGGGKEEIELKILAKSLGVLDKTIYFVGRINKEQLYIPHSLFDMAISTVLPIKELYANSANKVFDAFASGTPLMINHGGWIKDIIENNKCGIALPEVANQEAYDELYNFITNDDVMLTAKNNSEKLGDDEFNRDRLYRKLKKCIL
ncbi:glycosyltransferase family 4 protein [Vibrio diabolicus]|uniref:glycosyltransferase family 4 protein n=1 Tax=Vibrio diabolicus TaxID=50719 RepID=UPI003752AD56